MAKFWLILKFILLISFAKHVFSDIRIMNGTDAKPGQFPFMVSLQIKDERINYCGGALIGARWVLTAAHCTGMIGEKSVVIAGTVNCVNFDEGYQESRILFIYFPGELPDPEDQNDLALLRTRKKFVQTEFIKFLRYKHCKVSIGNKVQIMGWGIYNKGRPEILQWAKATVNDFKVCGSEVEQVNKQAYVCVRGNRNMSVPRAGDSGSPGIYNGRIFGVAAVGLILPEYGMYYTRTSFHHAWIKRVLEDHSLHIMRADHSTPRADVQMFCIPFAALVLLEALLQTVGKGYLLGKFL